MTGGIQTGFWRVVGRSVCGASHRRRKAANQDALDWSMAGSSAIVVSVADGHGSAASYRSAEGAALAVQSVIAVLCEFFERHSGSEATAEAAASIPPDLVSRWRGAVEAHVAAFPLAAGARGSNGGKPPWRVYGSTVLGVLATESYILCLQLGDGDILMAFEDGRVTRCWPRDPRLLGVETTSLCGEDAVEEMRISVEAVSGDSPALILLATDGYSNSFREDQGFLSTGRDLLEIVRQDGFDRVERDLESWLDEASALGSGDDITVAVVCRTGNGGGDGH